jgi:hypothetical protein
LQLLFVELRIGLERFGGLVRKKRNVSEVWQADQERLL